MKTYRRYALTGAVSAALNPDVSALLSLDFFFHTSGASMRRCLLGDKLNQVTTDSS
jgi:hypothetical protein